MNKSLMDELFDDYEEEERKLQGCDYKEEDEDWFSATYPLGGFLNPRYSAKSFMLSSIFLLSKL